MVLHSLTAIGCPNIELPSNAWMVRSADSIEIRCNHTKELWHLKCVGTEWIGTRGNCSGCKYC